MGNDPRQLLLFLSPFPFHCLLSTEVQMTWILDVGSGIPPWEGQSKKKAPKTSSGVTEALQAVAGTLCRDAVRMA